MILGPNDPRAVRRHTGEYTWKRAGWNRTNTHGGARTPGPNATGGSGHRANGRPAPDQPGAWMPHAPLPEHMRPGRLRALPTLDQIERR